MNADEKARLAALYRSGATVAEIADATGKTARTIKRELQRLRDEGEPVRPPRRWADDRRIHPEPPPPADYDDRLATLRDLKRKHPDGVPPAVLAAAFPDERGRARA